MTIDDRTPITLLLDSHLNDNDNDEQGEVIDTQSESINA